jgi:FAD binding domain/Berberine and berberine like
VTDLAGTDLASLQAALTGRVLGPRDADFDRARRVWNGAIDRRPAVIARCSDPGDVRTAIDFARRRGLEIAVRGGGHSLAGSSTLDDGLVIDLSALNCVRVDPGARRAWVGGGATLADRDTATQQHGLATPGGLVSHTGVGGLTLGGGLGWLARKAGLALDNVVSAEVVTADGATLTASAEENPDLHWAIRGGGGNFGVVSEFEFRLHEVGPQVQFGYFFWPLERGAEALRLCQEIVATTPNDLIPMPVGLNAPPEAFVPEPLRLRPGYGLILVGFGAESEHAAAVQRVRRGLPPLFDLVTPMPYLQLLRMFDAANGWGTICYDTAVCVEDLTEDVIAVVTEHHRRKESPLSGVFCYRLDGAFSEVGEDDTAFAGGRSPRYAVIVAAAAATAELLPAERAWARSFRDALRPHGIGRDVYVNMSDELTDEARVRASYGPAKYERLAQIKATYDPDNLFHRNANIPPAAAAAH